MNTVIIIFLSLTFLILISGLVVMAVGGNLNQRFANKLMTMRVISQGLLVAFLFLAYVAS